MATLTETAYYTRRAINWSILALIVYIILRIIWGGLVVTWLFLFPPKPPPPTHGYDRLPLLAFPDRPDIPQELTFRLETIQGRLPQASESARVYFMPKKAANLLALTEAQEFAKKLDLNTTPIRETKNLYRFEDLEVRLRKMQYDIVSNNFILRYEYDKDPAVFSEKEFKDPNVLTKDARSYLQHNSVLPQDLAEGSTVVTFLKLVSNSLYPTTSLSNADAIKVDFFRKAVAGLNVYTPYPDDGPVSMIYSGSRDVKKQLVRLAYTFWPIDYQSFETYSLKNTDQAWQELQSNGGYIARYPSQGSEAIVREVKLGYYDTFEPQTYLQPIYVFSGDYGFLGYVSAINPEWVSRPATPEATESSQPN